MEAALSSAPEIFKTQDNLAQDAFTGTSVPAELLPQERPVEAAAHRKIAILYASRSSIEILTRSADIGRNTSSDSELIFDAIKSLYLSRNTPRDRQIAERITALHRDALAEDESMRADSITQFATFF